MNTPHLRTAMALAALTFATGCASTATNGEQPTSQPTSQPAHREPPPPGPPESELIPGHLAYLDLLATAERQLTNGAHGPAAATARRALECRVRQAWNPMVGSEAAHATAHFVLARALAADDPEAAADHLREAAANGYSDKSRVATDAALEPLRSRENWDELLAAFRDEDATDEWAGVTVVDREDGYAVVRERMLNHPTLGETAPDFELPLADGSGSVRLSTLYRDKPVVLVFGSIT